MTVKELSQYYHYMREIRDIDGKITALETKALSAPAMSDMPKGKNNVNRETEGTALALEKFRRERAHHVRRAAEELYKLEVYINAIEDGMTRRIFRYRYCDCLTWDEVAGKMGQGYTLEAVKKRHNRYRRASRG